MSSNKCARCELTVYPVEGLRCLDKLWHKGCFKCHECNMTLSLKNYKGFEKRPYCNAHCPQAKATTVADTPEIRRLAENTRIQSQAKYHEDFEKSKGKGFTTIADDPETLRMKEASKIISNVAYHGELERKKNMEEKRGLSGQEEIELNFSKNNLMQQNNQNVEISSHSEADYGGRTNQVHAQHNIQQQQRLIHQQQIQQRLNQQHHQQQVHQKQQSHQMHFAQDHNGQPMLNRQAQSFEGHPSVQSSAKNHQPPVQLQLQNQQQYQTGQQLQQQQQLMIRQQQQQQLLLQQQRQMSEPNMPINRHQPKQTVPSHPQQMVKSQMMSVRHMQQPQMNFVPMNEPMMHQQVRIAGPQMIPGQQMGVIANGHRVPYQAMMSGPQASLNHNMMRGYNQYQVSLMNRAAIPKQQQQLMSDLQPRHQIGMHPTGVRQQHQQQVQRQVMHPQMQGRAFRAIYDYTANDVDEVSFFENDILIDCVNVDRNWLIGKVARTGETGMLPANYVTEYLNQ